MTKPLTAQEIADLLAGIGKRGGTRKDTTEPRDEDNWWNQRVHFIYRPDYEQEVNCKNPYCKDPRPNDKTIALAEIKGTLMCRYCFLDGYLSDS